MSIAPLAALLALGLSAPESVVETHGGVSLTFQGCDPVLAGEMRRLVALELGVTLAEDGSEQATRGVVVCEGTLFGLSVRDTATGRQLQRSIRLTGGDPMGQPRLIALALAELVLASWSGVSPDASASIASPPVQPLDVIEPQPATPVIPEEHGPFPAEISVAGMAQHFFLSAGMLWGAALRLDYNQLPSSFTLGIELGAAHQQTPDALGQIDINSVSIGVSEQATTRIGYFAFRLGLGIRLGVATVTGQPDNPNYLSASGTAPWLGAAILASTAFERGRFFARLELGYTLVPIQTVVEGQSSTGLDGPWATLLLGAGFAP
jgi:hypothetical protein